MKKLTQFIAIAGVALVTTIAAHAATITFTTELDEASDYSNGTVINQSGSSTPSISFTAGATGVVITTDLDDTADIVRYSLESSASYDPANGPIGSINWSADVRKTGSAESSTLLYPSLFQGGNLYFYTGGNVSGGDATYAFRETFTSFSSVSISSLGATDFELYNVTVTPDGVDLLSNGEFVDGSHPDFSGSEITFGYIAISATGSTTYTRDQEIDNSLIELAVIPEPASLTLLILGGLALVPRRRRRN